MNEAYEEHMEDLKVDSVEIADNKKMYVKSIIQDNEHGKCLIELCIYNYIDKKFYTEVVERERITPFEIYNLVIKNGGVIINSKNTCIDILNSINRMLVSGKYTLKRNISRLGWYISNDKIGFDAYESISEDNTNSIYNGVFDLKPSGSLEEIKVMSDKCITGHTPMEAIMSIGCLATLLSYSNTVWNTSYNNPIFHLAGNSTTGKSTAAKLIASFACNPNSNNSLYLSFMSTKNSLVKRIGNNNGLPCAIDEFSTATSKKEWTDFIYTLANGVEKDRCSVGGSGLQEAVKFCTVFVTNGEMSLLKKCNQNTGIRARLFELPDTDWTRNAEEADYIKSTIDSNYAILTPIIAKEILLNSEYWKKRIDFWMKKTTEKVKQENIFITISSRIVNYVALLAVSCEIISKVLNRQFNVEKVFMFFFTYMLLKNADECNIGKRAYEIICKYISDHRSEFTDATYTGDDLHYTEEGKKGFFKTTNRKRKIDNKEYDTYYIFAQETMEEILEKRCFTDTRIVMKELREAGYLKTKDSNRLYVMPRLEGILVKMYAIFVNVDDAWKDSNELD